MKDLVLKFIKKYPITFLSVLSFAILAIMMLQLGDVYTVTSKTEFLNELLMLSFNLIFGSFLCYKLLYIYDSKLPTNITRNVVISSALIVACLIVIHFISRIIFNIYMDDGIYGTYNVALLSISLSYYLIIKENDIDVSEYLVKVFMNTLFLFLIYCIVASGVAVLLYIYAVLFGELNWQYMMYIYIFITVIIGYIGLFITMEELSQKISTFTKVLVKYIMMIMVLVGFVFFYIYLLRIIISREIPSNQVFAVCTVLFFVGLIVALMSRTFDNNNLYDKTIKYLPIFFIPALLLQIISLYIRVSKYGFTLTRYSGVFIIIFEILYIAIYIYKYKKIKYLFIAQTIIIFVMSFMPFTNQYQFPKLYNKYIHNRIVSNKMNNNTNDIKKIKTCHAYKYENINEMDISGYNRLYNADIHIEYNEKEKTWQNYNQTSNRISDFTSVNVIDNDSKVITTIDISEFLDKIKQNIIKYDFTNDDEKVFENIDSYIVNNGKKYYINSIHVYYSDDIDNFTEVIMYGDLLIK